MFKKAVLTVFVALLALAIPASARATGAIVFSKVTEDHRTFESEGKVLPRKHRKVASSRSKTGTSTS